MRTRISWPVQLVSHTLDDGLWLLSVMVVMRKEERSEM